MIQEGKRPNYNSGTCIHYLYGLSLCVTYWSIGGTEGAVFSTV